MERPPKSVLTDNDVHARLCGARDLLGQELGKTVRGQTALSTARRALVLLQIALVSAMETGDDQLPGVVPDND